MTYTLPKRVVVQRPSSAPDWALAAVVAIAMFVVAFYAA